MRSVVGLFILLTALANVSLAQEKAKEKSPDKAADKLPSDKEIANAVGNRVSKVFPIFGNPVDVFVSDLTGSPKPFISYGTFGFKLDKNVVVDGFFFSSWKGTVYGAKMGDSPEDVIKKLGKPETDEKDDGGSRYLMYAFKDQAGHLEIDFDKDNKMNRAVVEAE